MRFVYAPPRPTALLNKVPAIPEGVHCPAGCIGPASCRCSRCKCEHCCTAVLDIVGDQVWQWLWGYDLVCHPAGCQLLLLPSFHHISLKVSCTLLLPAMLAALVSCVVCVGVDIGCLLQAVLLAACQVCVTMKAQQLFKGTLNLCGIKCCGIEQLSKFQHNWRSIAGCMCVYCHKHHVSVCVCAHRVLYGFSRDRAVPGWALWQKVDEKSGAPYAAGKPNFNSSLLRICMQGERVQ